MFIAGFEKVVGASTAGVHGTNGVAFELGSRGKGRSAEHVNRAVVWQRNAVITVEDIAGEIKLPLVSGDAVELDQGHFDFRMAGNDGLLGRRAIAGDQEVVDETDASVEHLGVAGGAIESDRAL